MTADQAGDERLLEVRDLRVRFRTLAGEVRAVDGVDLDIRRGEVFSVVGESGSGKSVTAMAVMGLLPASAQVSGQVRFAGEDLLRCDRRRLRALRGHEIAMVFQDPMTALNPLFTVGHQLAESLRIHRGARPRAAAEAAVEALGRVGIPDPRRRAADYPHQLSGGMRQRAVIAMATICEPKLLIADEPTTALDVTIQAQILELLLAYRAQHGTSILLITHDLGVVAGLSDRVMVMYAGQVHEQGTADDLFYEPRGPYTWGLLDSIPGPAHPARQRLPSIPGVPSGAAAITGGCRFAPRCEHREAVCTDEPPPLLPVGRGMATRCHFAADPDWSRRRHERSSSGAAG